MAKRYSGQVKATVIYRDGTQGNPRGHYVVSLSWPGGTDRVTYGEPAHITKAVDSPAAYDEMAATAIAGHEEASNHAEWNASGGAVIVHRKPAGLGGARDVSNFESNAEIMDELVEGFAWWIFAEAYMSAAEEAVEEGRMEELPWGPGDQVDSLIPDVPDEITEGARKILEHYFEKSGDAPFELVEREAGYDSGDPVVIGNYIGAHWIGSGAGDPSPDLSRRLDKHLGHGELHLFVEERDGNEIVELSYFGGTGLK